MQCHSCVYILRYAEPQNWFNSGVRSGCMFQYSSLKHLSQGQLLYILTFYFNIFVEKYKVEYQKKKKKKKSRPLFSDNLDRSEKGKQTSF